MSKRPGTPGTGKRAVKKLKDAKSRLWKQRLRLHGILQILDNENPGYMMLILRRTAEGVCGPAAHGAAGSRRSLNVQKSEFPKFALYTDWLSPKECATYTVGLLDEDSHADMH